MTTQTDAQGALPSWDLSSLYDGFEGPLFRADLAKAEGLSRDFSQDFRGKIAGLSAPELGEAIARYEVISDLCDRLGSYASLVYAENTTDPTRQKFYGDMTRTVMDLSKQTLFFTLEINRLEEKDLEKKLKDEALSRYVPWVRDIRRMRPYQLEDRLEELFHDKTMTGRTAWTRLFDETLAGMTFEVEDETLSLETTLHVLQEHDRAKRERASQALSKGFSEKIGLFTLVTNTLVQDKAISDRWRGYADPTFSRHLSNRVEPEVVEALVEAVRAFYPRLTHRYYGLKAKWMGMDRLAHYDRNAPLPEEEDRTIPWEEAKSTVLGAYRAFDPGMADVGARFFEEKWIDAALRPGKAPGAFSHPVAASAHPYILLNYQGRPRDVMTLAHELGHGVHQVWAAEQGALLAQTPLTLAETASVFGEMLTFRALLEGAQTPQSRKVLLANKVEDMLNTVVRQVAFYCFEKRVHDEGRRGELTAQDLGRLWMEIQEENLGPSVALSEEYSVFWSYIPHFIHAPFYVYAYAFGEGLVHALCARYDAMGDAFKPHYFTLLKAGGSAPYRELLEPLGLDPTSPEFWSLGLLQIDAMITTLEGE